MLCVFYEWVKVLLMVKIFLMNRVVECHPITDSLHIYGLVNVCVFRINTQHFWSHVHYLIMMFVFVYVYECFGHIHHKHSIWLFFFFKFILFFIFLLTWNLTLFSLIPFHSIPLSLPSIFCRKCSIFFYIQPDIEMYRFFLSLYLPSAIAF